MTYERGQIGECPARGLAHRFSMSVGWMGQSSGVVCMWWTKQHKRKPRLAQMYQTLGLQIQKKQKKKKEKKKKKRRKREDKEEKRGGGTNRKRETGPGPPPFSSLFLLILQVTRSNVSVATLSTKKEKEKEKQKQKQKQKQKAAAPFRSLTSGFSFLIPSGKAFSRSFIIHIRVNSTHLTFNEDLGNTQKNSIPFLSLQIQEQDLKNVRHLIHSKLAEKQKSDLGSFFH